VEKKKPRPRLIENRQEGKRPAREGGKCSDTRGGKEYLHTKNSSRCPLTEKGGESLRKRDWLPENKEERSPKKKKRKQSLGMAGEGKKGGGNGRERKESAPAPVKKRQNPASRGKR